MSRGGTSLSSLRGALSAAILGLAAVQAHAQSLPSWRGFHAGITGGYVRSEADFFGSDLAAAGILTPGSITDLAANGSGVGLLGGYDWQTGPLVLGYDFGWTRYGLRADRGFTGVIPPFGAVAGTIGTEIDWIVTARARAGIAAGWLLLYGTAGLSVTRTSGELVIPAFGATLSDSALLGGWQIGAGIEFLLTPFLSARAELTRTRISDDMFSFAVDRVPLSGRMDVIHLRGGVSLRF